MKVIVLCGGLGVRFKSIFPKPLNLIHGKPLIYWSLKTLPYDDIVIVYNYKLDEYNFTHTVEHLFPEKTFTFIKIKYDTRGPVETLYVGCQQLVNNIVNESILVLDNDTCYDCESLLQIREKTNGILYSERKDQSLSHYSFVKIENDGRVIDIKERVPISNTICVGGYLFESLEVALTYLKKTLHTIENEKEAYMSIVYENMLSDKLDVVGYKSTGNLFILGTVSDCKTNSTYLTEKIRVVFDLDNTIITLGSNKKVISRIKDFILFLHSQGHVIVIQTARGMKSCNSNLGKVLKKSACIVINWLEEEGIPYDEIYFGKPEGDLYIDDRAFNAYDSQLFKSLGFYEYERDTTSATNQKTKIWIEDDKLYKYSHTFYGEKFYYSTIKKNISLSQYFPQFISDNDTYICLEYLKGSSPLSHIYSNGLLTEDCFRKFLNAIDELHSIGNTIDDGVVLTQDDLRHHYLDKFLQRASYREEFPFSNFEEVFESIHSFIKEYTTNKIEISNLIHGDCWFSNVLLYKGAFKFIDMRGSVNGKYTIKGDRVYDYAKCYQSIVGLDSILDYDQPIGIEYRSKIESVFWEYIREKGINPETIKKMTNYMIFNTFHFYPKGWKQDKLQMIWDCIKLS